MEGSMSGERLSRRDALKLGGAAASAVVLGRALPASAATWKKVPIGTQLWCVRKQLAQDVPGTLKAVGALGFEAVELENAFGRSGAEWKSHLDAAKLSACGFHHRLSELQGDQLAKSVEFNQAIGNRNLIIRSLPKEVYASADLLKKTADEVNRVDGEYWWNRFADLTSKDVILQFDTGNASEAEGVAPQAFIERNAGRTISMHVKPHSKKDPNAYIGADELDWKAIMTAAESKGGIEWYIIEYEKEGVPPLESLKANLDLFKKLRS
jgi:hypothetical protein